MDILILIVISIFLIKVIYDKREAGPVDHLKESMFTERFKKENPYD